MPNFTVDVAFVLSHLLGNKMETHMETHMEVGDTELAAAAVCLVGGVVYLSLSSRRVRKKNRRTWMRPWLTRRDCDEHNTMMGLYQELLLDGDVQEYRATLRMPPDVYNELLETLRPKLTLRHTNFRKPIPADTRLAITLRYLALGDCFLTLSQEFRVGRSTARQIVKSTCQAIVETMMQEYLKTPSTQEEWLELARTFEERWNLPHAVAAVDGKHVRILAPPSSGSLYYNYKDFYSIVLMAAVDGDYRFIYADVGAEGRCSDGGVWSRTALKLSLEEAANPLRLPQPSVFPGAQQPVPYYVVGDDAFKLSPYLLKPYPGRGCNDKERIYNYRISRARRIVENAFGIMANRFRLLLRSIELQGESQKYVVMSCCILHNFLRTKAASSYMSTSSIDQEERDGSIAEGAWRADNPLLNLRRSQHRNPSQYAKEIRDEMASYFVSASGEVDWQYRLALGSDI